MKRNNKLEIQAQEVKSLVLVQDYLREIVVHQIPLIYDKVDLITNKKCKCPLHDDTTESLQYNEETNTFKCTECGRSGDIIELDRLFILKVTGELLSEEESIEYLHVRFLNKQLH